MEEEGIGTVEERNRNNGGGRDRTKEELKIGIMEEEGIGTVEDKEIGTMEEYEMR